MSTKPPPPPEEKWEMRRCTCAEYEWPEQVCPFAAEIYDETEPGCRCCPFCTEECAQDI